MKVYRILSLYRNFTSLFSSGMEDGKADKNAFDLGNAEIKRWIKRKGEEDEWYLYPRLRNGLGFGKY